MSHITRRAELALTAAATLRPGALCAKTEVEEAAEPFGWFEGRFEGKTYYKRGRSERSVVLLHEINGLSPGCIDLGVQLADAGFTVFMPLLFGHPGMNSVLLGAVASCVFGGFHCYANGKNTNDTQPVQWTRRFVEELEKQTEIRSIGVIGMCQSGAYPLAVMRRNSKVRAVIMSQPALPFGESRQANVGIAETTVQAARESEIPILAFRFRADHICMESRFQYLEKCFGERQFQAHEFDCPGLKMTWDHRLHALLTESCSSAREEARALAVEFLTEYLS